MIEVNLIPDVKLELLKARRQHKLVISASIAVAIISVGLVVLMSVFTFGGQALADNLAQSRIDDKTKELKGVEDLSQTLTLQAQLNKLTEVQGDKNISSRLFDILSVVVPSGDNAVKITRLNFKSEENTIELEAEAANGYEAMEVFKKTLAETTFHYNEDDEAAEPENIATGISEGERTYGEDSNGKRILRFTLSFTYPDKLFDATITDGKVVAPNQQRATDSSQGIPESIFSNGGEQ